MNIKENNTMRKYKELIYPIITLIVSVLFAVFAPNVAMYGRIVLIFGQTLQIALLVRWAVMLGNRITYQSYRKYFIAIAVMMIYWLSIRTAQINFCFDDLALYRHLEYMTFIPKDLIPVLCLCVASMIGRENDAEPPKECYVAFFVAVIFSSMTIINDFNGYCFKFDGKYRVSYGKLYYVQIIFIICILICTLVVTVSNSKEVNKTGITLFVLAVSAVCIAFWIFIILRESFVDFYENMDFVFCFFLVEVIEYLIMKFVIPVNSSYKMMFNELNSAIQITDSDFNVKFETNNNVRFKREDLLEAVGGVYRFSENILLKGKSINGGYVFWLENINELIKKIENELEIKKQLQVCNELLTAELAIKENEVKIDTAQYLHKRLIGEVSTLLKQICDDLDGSMNSDEDRKEILIRTTYRFSYIKRRLNLFLLMEEKKRIDIMELYYSMRECMQYVNLTGKKGSVYIVYVNDPTKRDKSSNLAFDKEFSKGGVIRYPGKDVVGAFECFIKDAVYCDAKRLIYVIKVSENSFSIERQGGQIYETPR